MVPENAPIEQPPAKRPRLDPTALHKQQPATQAAAQQAAQQDAAAAKAGEGIHGVKGAGGGAAVATPAGDVAVQPPVRHHLSRELQVYFDRLVGLLQAAAAAEDAAAAAAGTGDAAAAGVAPAVAAAAAHGEAAHKAAAAAPGAAPGTSAADRHDALFRAALTSLSTDPGLHPLAPYFTAYIADGVAHNLSNVPLLRRLLALARALLVNPGIQMDLYLHQLLPAVLTCMLTKTLGVRGGQEHWGLREQAAGLAALAARLFGAPYHNVAPRLVRLMAKAFMDPGKGLACKYGAVVGLQVRPWSVAWSVGWLMGGWVGGWARGWVGGFWCVSV